MEAVAAVGHVGQLEVVGGYHAAHRHPSHRLKEHARAVQLVEGVGAFQYLVENDEGARRVVADALQQLFQSQQFGIEVTYAMLQVVGGAHRGEKVEHADGHLAGKDRHSRHCEDVVNADGAQEGALACHVGTGNDVVVAVTDGEIVTHGFCPEEGMPQRPRIINHRVAIGNDRHHGLWMTETEG